MDKDYSVYNLKIDLANDFLRKKEIFKSIQCFLQALYFKPNDKFVINRISSLLSYLNINSYKVLEKEVIDLGDWCFSIKDYLQANSYYKLAHKLNPKNKITFNKFINTLKYIDSIYDVPY